ncbi:restriction endonuclease subunit S [Novosphingobium sp. Leaf2]|uniref:restriction endonuclease subunit S n=1 Tax=Novosphingobium sp. Leaf2 TaxID=1735670 RepID=UPI00228673CB|nr:restriction endonuclease subunit S [Novosphingobium sp. Leaf2]
MTGLKRAYSIAGGSTPKSDVEEFWDGDIPWITPGDLSKLRTKFISQTARMITDSGLASCAASLSPAGSIVVSTRAPIGSLAVTRVKASTNQGCKTLIPTNETNAVFGFYTLSIATEQLNVRGRGSTFLEISADDLGAFAVPFPPLDEQVAIVAFLDRETAKIDALIEEQRRLITLLKEKRQSVISHAVTNGLNAQRVSRTSGIEWLGAVPEHWELKRAKFLFKKSALPPPEDGEVVTCFRDGQVTLRANRREDGFTFAVLEVGYQGIENGQLVLHSMDAFAGAIGVSDSRGKCSPEYLVCDPTSAEIEPAYYGLLLRLMALRGFILAACPSVRERAPRIRFPSFGNLLLPVPPHHEQKAIVQMVAESNAKLDEFQFVAEKAIGILQERRSAVISAAVTGKIDVRQSATILPFPIDRVRARRFVAAEIIERLAHQPTFGRTKLQKVAYLAEAHANITELAGCYIRMPFGPLDQPMMDEIEANGGDDGIVIDDKRDGSMVRYRTTGTKGGHTADLRKWLGEERFTKLDHLIKVLSGLKTHSAEAIATLYAVWNDALIEGRSLTDEQIFSAFFSWHPKKGENFRADELPHWLDWMRRHGIVPTGSGSKTMSQIGTLL